MPQVDLEVLVSAFSASSSDRKITCETLADDGGEQSSKVFEPDLPADFPPESFWLSKDAELDWFDRNAFIERKDSTKGSGHSTNLNPNLIPGSHSNSNSQRFSLNLKSKRSMIGLPKTQKTNYVDTKNRKNGKQTNIRLFPKRSGSAPKSDSSLVEPSSPKVSCIGRVRSKRERKRRLKIRQKSIANGSRKESEQGTKIEIEIEKPATERRHRNGFFASVRAIFRSTRRNKEPKAKDKKSYRRSNSKRNSWTRTHDIRSRLPPHQHDTNKSYGNSTDNSIEAAASATEPVGLGGMNRFTSGRRSETWITGIDVA